MEKPSYESYQPVTQDSDTPISEEEFLRLRSRSRYGWLRRHVCVLAVCTSLLVSVALNGFQYSKQISLPNFADERKPGGQFLSGFSGLKFDTSVVYDTYTDYWAENKTMADQLWDDLESDAIAITLTDDYVREHNIPKSERFPWDTERSIYFIKAFHHTHCLKLMYRALTDFERHGETSMEIGHLYHCLDTMRQDVMCIADDTIMPTVHEKHKIGDKQVMQCRNWDKLVEWAHAPERHSCFKMVNEYGTPTHPIEDFARCPKDSQHYPVMKAYFDKHGFVSAGKDWYTQ